MPDDMAKLMNISNDDFIRMFGSMGREPGAETIY